MYLTIDFGNTASKYALFSEEGILHSHGVYNDVSDFVDQGLKGCIFSTVRKRGAMAHGFRLSGSFIQ